MVEIPPDGYKRMKNSRKMQMVFFVHEGKVTVDIEDVQFGMTKGGVWQVPRGEFLLSFLFVSVLFPFTLSSASFVSSWFALAKEQRSEVFLTAICINKQLGKFFMHIQHTPTMSR